MAHVLDGTPGHGKKFVVTMDGSPFAGFDTHEDATRYIAMQMSKVKGGTKLPAAAATRKWTIEAK